MLVCVDHYTSQIKVLCVASEGFSEAAEWFYNMYASKGVEIVHADNGKPFISKLITAFLDLCKIKAAHGKAYNPST
jgi:hypothetical protein